MRFTKMLAGLACALGLITAGFVGTASAGQPASTVKDIKYGPFCEQSSDNGENGAKSCWKPYGDTFRVCDIDHDDNQHAWGRIKWRSPNGELHKRTEEDGGDSGCDKRSLRIREDRVITVISCVQNGAHGDLRGCDREKGWSGNVG